MFRHTATLLLTACILMSSVGVALSEQLCLMTGLKQAAMEQPDGCCSTLPGEPEADDCCTTAMAYEKLEPVSSVKHLNFEAPAFFQPLLKLTPPAQTSTPASDDRLLTYTDSSPPLYGRSLLHRLHILRV